MAYFALLWKARTIEKYRLKYEKEKNKSLLSSSHIQPKTWSEKLDDYRYDVQKRISNTFKRLYPEGSAKSIFFAYLRTDQTFPNFVLKSVLGFAGGIILTYICFIFFVFQLSISLLHATVMSSIIGVLLTLGLAFSYRIRCLVFLLIPQFFSRVGRYSLTCYALVLILTGPATNTLKNSEVLSESMACRQEQIKTSVSQVSDAMKKPLNAMKDCLGLMMERLNLVAAKMKKSVVIMHRLVMSVESLIKLSLSWLEATAMHVNKILKTPYARCAQVLEDGVESCKKNLGPDFWACSVPFVTEASCSGVRQYMAFCSLTGYVDGVLATVKRKLNTFEQRVRALFFVEVHIHHSYSFSSNASRSASQVAAGIVTEIRNRADPLLTWLSWSSCVTSLFLLLIIFRAKYYQHMYETRSRFDNRYITKELRELDLERQRQGRETVLPLNRRERAKYVTTTSFRLVSSEKVHLSRSAVFMVITTLKLLIHMIADYSLYWVLMTIRYHGRFQSAVPGIQHAGVQVSGKGFVAGLLRSLVGTLDIPLKASTLPPASCLPLPYPPDFRRYTQIGILICLLWFFALFEPYGLRLRHIIMRHYRPERAKARAVWLYNHFFRTQASFMKLSRRKLHREYMYNSEAKHTFRRWINERLHCRWLQVLLGTAETPHCLLCSTTGNTTDDDKKLIRCKTPNCPGVYCASCYSDIGQLCTICLAPKDYGDYSDDSLEKGSSDDESDSQEDTAPTRPGVSGTSIEKDNYHSNKDSGRKNKTQLLNKKDSKHSLETPLLKQISYQLSHVTSTNHRSDTLQPNTSERNKINILRNNIRSHISNLTEKSKPDKDSKITSSNTKNSKKYYNAITKISYYQNRTRNIFPGYRLLNRLKIFITPKKRKRKPIRIRISFNSITLSQQYVFLRRKILLNSSLQKLKKRCKRTEATKTNQTTSVTASGNINRRKRVPKSRKVKRIVFMDTNTFANNNLKTIPQHKVISCSHIISIGKNAELNAVDLRNKNNKIENEKENQKENNQQPKKNKGLKLPKHGKPDSKNTDANKKTDSHQSFEKLSKQWFKYWKNLKINVIPCADCMTSDAICTDENKTFKRRKKEKVLGKKTCECKPCPEREAIKNARNYRISTYLAEQIWGTNGKSIVDKNKSESAISSVLKKLKWQAKEVKKADSLAETKILKNCVVNLQWDRKPNVKGCICYQDSCQCLENPSAILEEKSLAKKATEKTAIKRFRQRVRRQTKPTGKLLPTLVSSVSVAQEMTADDRLNLSNSITKRLGYYQAFGIKDFDEQSMGYGDYAQEDNKYFQHKEERLKSHKTDDENDLHSDGHVQASNKDQAGPSMRIKAENEDHRDIDVSSQEQAKCHYQRRGPLMLLKQLCSTIFATSSDEIKSNLDKQDKHINSASKGVLANPKTETCGCQYSTEKNHSQDQCIQVRTLKSVDNVRDKAQKCLCDAGISAVNKTCTCATQNFKIKNDGTLKLFKGQTICHRNPHGKRRCKSSERSYTKFEENLARDKKHTPRAPTSPGNNSEIRRTIQRSLSSSISQSLSSILSDGTRTDTTVCSVATIDCRGRSKGHRLRVTVVTKTNQATLTDRKKVCDVSTFIDDWWSPLVEKRHKEISLEKKKGGHALQEKEERRRHVQRERNERHNIYKHSTGVATDRKLVTFRSRAQIIPTKTMDILSPSRYLLESQKYYNELFSSKLYAPQVFPVAQLMTPQKVEGNHQTVENRHGNRRSSKVKRVDETSSPRRQSSPKRRNPSWTTESVKKQTSCKANKHRNRSSINGVKKSKIKQRLNEGRDRDSRYQLDANEINC